MHKIFMLLFTVLLLSSCEEEKTAEISVKNNISNISMTSIYFGDNYIGSGLLPGQSRSLILYGYDYEWPLSGNIAFLLSANGNSVYLLTDSIYTINAGDVLEIDITDATPVYNP